MRAKGIGVVAVIGAAVAIAPLACSGGDESSGATTISEAGPYDAGTSDARPEEASAPNGCSAPSITLADPTKLPRMMIAGDGGTAPLGIFDPSIVYPVGAPGGAMSYSAVEATDRIATRIALSNDKGLSWAYLTSPNDSYAIDLPTTDVTVCGAATCSGRIVHEVSSLVFDPTDVVSKRWKLLVHSYFTFPDAGAKPAPQRYDWGHIAMQTAPGPEGPWSALAPVIGWTSSAPQMSTTNVPLNVSTIPALADCVALTEPSAIVLPGALDLALGCVHFANGAAKIRIDLLRSVDHGATWGYVGKLLDGSDATCLGGAPAQLNAAHLFTVGAKEYLIASTAGVTGGYNGCVTVEIADPAKGIVKRDDAGAPVVLRRLAAPNERFSGACAYAEGATALGYVVPIAFFDQAPDIFRIYYAAGSAP